jgi:integrase
MSLPVRVLPEKPWRFLMGSVYQQRSSGKWYASVVIDGRRVTRHAKTERQAKQKLAELETQKAAGQAPPVAKTVGELLERWIATEQPRWKAKTLHEYRRLIDNLIIPEIGKLKLARLPADRVQRFVDGIVGDKQRVNLFRLLHRAFSVAMRWGWLPVNPMDRIEPPRYRASRPNLPNTDQIRKFLSSIVGHRWEPWITVAVHSGIRFGEQAALRWTDIDFDSSTIQVERSGQHISGEWVESIPKTSAGNRIIRLPQPAIDALRRQEQFVTHWRQKANHLQNMDLVFPGRLGQPLAQNTVGKAIKRLLVQNGLPPLSPHKLRHVGASVLLSQGIPLPVVSRRLGHANTNITATIYAHAMNTDDEAADALNEALG